MSAALKTSITKLDQAVNKLETVIDKRTQSAKGSGEGQNDLFGAMAATRKSNDNVTEALAEKLDSVITKVEKILQEG